MNFTGFCGNYELKERLSNMFSGGRVPHAFIIEGAAGLGKKTLAALIANAVVCKAEGERPCGVCGACVRARDKSHPDIITVEGSGKTGAISVDSIRTVKEDAYVKPSEADKKVYILPDADRTLPAAQNAFLKVLEEPPASAMFIITCVSSLSLLDTIRSRTVVLRVSELSETDAVAAVRLSENVPERDILAAYAFCGGNAGMIKARLSDSQMGRYMALSGEIAKAMLSPKEIDIVLASAPLEKDRDAFNAVMSLLAVTARDALIMKNGGAGGLSGDAETVKEFAGRLTSVKLTAVYEACNKLIEGNKRSVNMGLLTSEMCLLLRRAAGIS